ncbi:MAG: hypothetical protein HGB03_02970 [Candidatus Yonathbacteria bacterium]|nr:hypothetical protein [Candidatus Yonathbacteria bacterium]NTW47403.1 hypothetical protein [Candidatus Yonathbacteria bacterium]
MKQTTLHTIETISLSIFLVCMLACATIAIASIWLGWFDNGDDHFTPIIPTLFIIGLASFLIWLPIVIYKLIEALKGK